MNIQGTDRNYDNTDNEEDKLLPQLAPERQKQSRTPAELIKKMLIWTVVGITVFGMILSWIATGELVQEILKTFNKPFAIAIYTRLSWIVYLLLWGVWSKCIYKGREVDGVLDTNPLGMFEWKYYIKWATILGFVGFYSGWTWYLSLAHTAMATNTALYQTGPVFVFLISVPLLGEKVTIKKALAVGLCVGGAIAISFGKGAAVGTNSSNTNETDTQTYTHQGFGYSMVLLSTLLYALLEVGYKAKCSHDDDPVAIPNTFRFLGLIGCAVVLNFPVVPILHYTGVEEFEWPDERATKFILLNAAADAIFNISFYVCITLTSPLFCSIATILTMPVSIVADIILKKHDNLTSTVYIGIGMIAIGFVTLTLAMGHGGASSDDNKTKPDDDSNSSKTKKVADPIYEYE